jgi:hypothetical protein
MAPDEDTPHKALLNIAKMITRTRYSAFVGSSKKAKRNRGGQQQ